MILNYGHLLALVIFGTPSPLSSTFTSYYSDGPLLDKCDKWFSHKLYLNNYFFSSRFFTRLFVLTIDWWRTASLTAFVMFFSNFMAAADIVASKIVAVSFVCLCIDDLYGIFLNCGKLQGCSPAFGGLGSCVLCWPFCRWYSLGLAQNSAIKKESLMAFSVHMGSFNNYVDKKGGRGG